MKKILLILVPLVFIGMKFDQVNSIKPAKEELSFKEVAYAPAQCTASLNNDLINGEAAPYVHCNSCGYGAFLGEEGHEKCTFCGVKKTYVARK